MTVNYLENSSLIKFRLAGIAYWRRPTEWLPPTVIDGCPIDEPVALATWLNSDQGVSWPAVHLYALECPFKLPPDTELRSWKAEFGLGVSSQLRAFLGWEVEDMEHLPEQGVTRATARPVIPMDARHSGVREGFDPVDRADAELETAWWATLARWDRASYWLKTCSAGDRDNLVLWPEIKRATELLDQAGRNIARAAELHRHILGNLAPLGSEFLLAASYADWPDTRYWASIDDVRWGGYGDDASQRDYYYRQLQGSVRDGFFTQHWDGSKWVYTRTDKP